MSRIFAAIAACSLVLVPTITNAADQFDRAAIKQATATCRTEVKEHAKYNAMSTLTAVVKKGGTLDLKFDLESK